jgi:hypothetical protein
MGGFLGNLSCPAQPEHGCDEAVTLPRKGTLVAHAATRRAAAAASLS